MKRYFLVALFLTAIAASTFAQKPSAESIRKRLSIGFGVFNDFWMKVPDSISPRKINQGADVFVNYTFPMDRQGHVSFFVGAGLGMHNFYSQALLGMGKYNVYNKALIADQTVSYFYNAPAKINGQSITLKKSKLSITYFDIPFGFQYKATNKMHATLGFKVGWSINGHTKYKGSDLKGSGNNVVEKSSRLLNIQSIHYGPYAVIGYKWFGISVFYQLTPVFEKELGPPIFPVSVGLVFKP